MGSSIFRRGRMVGEINMKKERMKELLEKTLSELQQVVTDCMDNDAFGDFITENFTREEAEEFGQDGWFGNNDEEIMVLPKEVVINQLCILENEDADEVISEWLSENYGYCVNSFLFELEDVPEPIYPNGPTYKVTVTNIDWDTEE